MKLFAVTLLIFLLTAGYSYSQNTYPKKAIDSSGVTVIMITESQLSEINARFEMIDECSENNDSLLSQIKNADATLAASRKVNADLRLLKQNCDSINSEKDKQIKYYLNSFRAEKDISNFYKSKSNSWIAVSLLSLVCNGGLLYLNLRH